MFGEHSSFDWGYRILLICIFLFAVLRGASGLQKSSQSRKEEARRVQQLLREPIYHDWNYADDWQLLVNPQEDFEESPTLFANPRNAQEWSEEDYLKFLANPGEQPSEFSPAEQRLQQMSDEEFERRLGEVIGDEEIMKYLQDN